MRLLIYGSGDFALTVADLVRACGHDPVGMVDDFTPGNGVLGSLEQVSRSHPPESFGIALAIGYKNLTSRWRAWQRVRSHGYETPVLIHPRAYVAPSATIGPGSMVMVGAVVDTRTKIGEASVIWPCTCVNHDVSIGNNCFISPNSTVCGFVSIGSDCFIGANSAIADHCDVPAGTFIKISSSYTRRNL